MPVKSQTQRHPTNRPWWRIISRIQGGLGNQLFIYASSIELGHRLGLPVRFDTVSAFRRDTFERRYELAEMGIKLTPANPLESLRLRGRSILVRYMQKLEARRPLGERHFLCQGSANDCEILEPQDRKRWLYMDGYWQDFRFFDRRRPGLMEIAHQARVRRAEELAKWRGSRSVGIHVRQLVGYSASGRWVYDAKPILTMDYYLAALHQVVQQVPIDVVLLFGDDHEFRQRLAASVHNSLKIGTKVIEGSSSVADLLLMTCCDALVLSPSTFAWWAAYLNPAARIIVHPGVRDNGAPFPTPENWRILQPL